MLLRRIAAGLVVLVALSGCGSGGAAENAAETATPVPSPTSTPTPELTPTLTADQLAQVKPNELGQIMVLMYHTIDDSGDDYARTADGLREDLQWLYDNGFYVIPIDDYINDEIAAPAGKRPVVLTFDDGTVSQFRYIVNADGSKMIDPDCAVGILENFFTRHPDFGRGGLFSILPLAPFAWPDAEDQRPYAQEKIRWLLDHGYQIGNHTVGHVNFSELTDEEIKAELAGAIEEIRTYAPDAQPTVLAVPFGVYPAGGDTTLFEGFDYHGQHYALTGALMVGANPAPSPVDGEFDPYWIPRIRGSQEELDKWFGFAEENPGIIYVSDGNPEAITIPEEVDPWLAGTLDEAKIGSKTLIRY